MRVTLSKLKFFVRPQVFQAISEFAIECLKKLDLKKEESEAALASQASGLDNPATDDKESKNEQGKTTAISFKLLESILVLERREF